jgi:hypothetical protein
MYFAGGMDLQALAQLNDIDLAGGAPNALSSRAIDSDGDSRPDLFLVDLDSDGSVDGVVRGLDTNADGVNDTFVQYNEDGSIESIGRVNPATGELDVVYEEPGAFDEILSSLGLIDLQSPEEALFTSFEDPYILDTYGSFGEEVPDVYVEPAVVDDFTMAEVTEDEANFLETEAIGEEPEAASQPADDEMPASVTPRIVEIEDRSGGDASSVWAKVDRDADGLADDEVRIEKTSVGDYYGDINRDGYSEGVATDLDSDNRIDTVDTTGQGSSVDTVSAESVVDPGSSYLADQGPSDDLEAASAIDPGDAAEYDADAGATVETSSVDVDPGPVDSGGDDSV